MAVLSPEQIDAIRRMKNGCILCGGVGSGKSRTAIGYYYTKNGGSWDYLSGSPYRRMKTVQNLYIITTAKKRDSREWEGEFPYFLLGQGDGAMYPNLKIVVDSWNNIQKYQLINNAFFIFDEQRLIGSGAWVKAFYHIAEKNNWVLLSATPGDCWMDYIPVFVANGFYRNKTDFVRSHVIPNPHVKYFSVMRYWNISVLESHRADILVDIDVKKHTIRHDVYMPVDYDTILYKDVWRRRWNVYKQQPAKNAGDLCYILRRVANSDDSRSTTVLELAEKNPRLIIFYNFDYELEILRALSYPIGTVVAEWNSHKHEPVPKTEKWIYLVQYTAGCEGWNCVQTDSIIFYSLNYSYRIMEQAKGRIDRRNTAYTDLYYYILRSAAPIDVAVLRAIRSKKDFNYQRFTTSVYERKFNQQKEESL